MHVGLNKHRRKSINARHEKKNSVTQEGNAMIELCHFLYKITQQGNRSKTDDKNMLDQM